MAAELAVGMGFSAPGWTVCGRLKFMLKLEYTLELLEFTGNRPLSGGTCRIVGRPGPPFALYALYAFGSPAADGNVGDERSLTAAATAPLSGTCSACLSATVFEAGVGSSAICSSGPVPPRTQFPHLSAM